MVLPRLQKVTLVQYKKENQFTYTIVTWDYIDYSSSHYSNKNIYNELTWKMNESTATTNLEIQAYGQ